MYLVVRESLGMSPGKVAAQVEHAVQMLMREWLPDARRALTEREYDLRALAREWDRGEYGKVVLRASDAEFVKVQLEHGEFFLVVDNGHTEVAPRTETVIGLWPMRKSSRGRTLRRLRLL